MLNKSLTYKAKFAMITSMKVWKGLIKIIGIAWLSLAVYMVYALSVTAISLKMALTEDEQNKQENIMYCDETIRIIRYNMCSNLLLEFDRIEIQNGKTYLFAFSDTCCFKALYERERHRKPNDIPQIDIENIISEFYNYYENPSVVQLMKCYVDTP